MFISGFELTQSDRLSLLFIWGQAEPNATIIAASIPVLRVFFRDLHRTKYGSSKVESTGTYLKSDNHSKFPQNSISSNWKETSTQDDTRGSWHNLESTTNKIICTREVDVQYDSNSQYQEDVDAIEMSNRRPTKSETEKVQVTPRNR